MSSVNRTPSRRAKRRDLSEAEIVDALEECGVRCFRLDQPCDLLVLCRGVISLLDCGRARKAKRMPAQRAMFKEWNVIEVSSPTEALEALGLI